MKIITFVCLGNICRSPMAEMMLRQLVTQKHLEKEVQVRSRSTSTYEIGSSPHMGAIQELQKKSVPLVEHKAKQITKTDFDQSDLIIGMDQQNIIDLKHMAPVADKDKIHLAFEALNRDAEVQDPWYDHNFDRTYNQLNELLPIWLDKLTTKKFQ